jgi:hypothetical protein
MFDTGSGAGPDVCSLVPAGCNHVGQDRPDSVVAMIEDISPGAVDKIYDALCGSFSLFGPVGCLFVDRADKVGQVEIA